jgi:hypothetical protein
MRGTDDASVVPFVTRGPVNRVELGVRGLQVTI